MKKDKKFSQEFSVASSGADIKEGTRGSRLVRVSISSFFASAILVSIGVVAFSIIFFLSEVDGTSMMQTLNAYSHEHAVYDNVLVNRYVKPKRGDIIVVRHYSPNGLAGKDENGNYDYFIKRLIATENDKIYFAKDPDTGFYNTMLNGEKLLETYLDPHWGIMDWYGRDIANYIDNGVLNQHTYNGERVTFITPFPSGTIQSVDGINQIVVPAGYVFFMGDNRGGEDFAEWFLYHSWDSTAFGPQPASYIEGVVADIIYEKESVQNYVWRKITQFFSFKWLF